MTQRETEFAVEYNLRRLTADKIYVTPTGGQQTTLANALASSVGMINAVNFGASASASDNQSALQAAINAAIAQGKALYIPAVGPTASGYKYTAPLTINGNLTIVGDYVSENWGTATDTINVPQGVPLFAGSVLCPSSNGSPGLDIVGWAPTVNISNIGINFQTPYAGTGDGIRCLPPAIGGGGFRQGLSGSAWTNVKVIGHDGNHYAYNITNLIYNTFDAIFGYGGGGLNLVGNPNSGVSYNFGNSTFNHPYFQVYVGGTAHGYNLTASVVNNLNLLTFIGPQSLVQNQGAGYTPPSPSPPTIAQYAWKMDANTATVRLIAPTFESNINAPVLLTANGGNSYDYDQSLVAGRSSVAVTLSGTPINQAVFPTAQAITAGFFEGVSTGGTVNFNEAFPHACISVVFTGWGTLAKLAAAPTASGFTYAQDVNGRTYYMAYGY